jgi:hypothetical protein
MFRPTTAIGVIGLALVGVIIADFLIHPQGTQDAANGIVSIEKPGLNAMLGSTS